MQYDYSKLLQTLSLAEGLCNTRKSGDPMCTQLTDDIAAWVGDH